MYISLKKACFVKKLFLWISFSFHFQLKSLLDKALHKRTKSFSKKGGQHADDLSTVHEAYQYLMKTYPGVQSSMPIIDRPSGTSKSTRRRISQTSMGTISNSSSRRSSDTSSVISFNEVVEVVEGEFKRPTSANIPIRPMKSR